LLTYLHTAELGRIPDVCALCEEYTSKALDYINENKTQSEVIDILHNTCHQFHTFEKKVGQILNLVFWFWQNLLNSGAIV
jgi:saposin